MLSHKQCQLSLSLGLTFCFVVTNIQNQKIPPVVASFFLQSACQTSWSLNNFVVLYWCHLIDFMVK